MGVGVGAEFGGVDALQGADAVGKGAAVAHPQVVLHVVVFGAEVVDVAVGPLVAHVHIVVQAMVPLPSAGGAGGLEGGGTLVAEHHVVEPLLAVDIDVYAHTVAHMQLVAGVEEGEAAVGIDAAEGLAKLHACAVVRDAVNGGVVAVEQGTPGGEGRGVI